MNCSNWVPTRGNANRSERPQPPKRIIGIPAREVEREGPILAQSKVARAARTVREAYDAEDFPDLTEPLVRDGAALREATWDEALDRAAAGISAAVARNGARVVRLVQLFEGDERTQLPSAEIRARGHRLQQRRQLQPDVTRSERRRSGGGFRCRRRHELVSGGRGDRPDHPLGIERARNASDLLSPRPKSRSPRRVIVRGRPAPHGQRAVGRRTWLGVNVGSDIALSNAMAHEILAARSRESQFHRSRDVRLRSLSRERGRATTPTIRRVDHRCSRRR